MALGIILFGHGSRDPAWRAPMDAVAARVRAADPACLVTCAFLELDSPDLPTAATGLVAAGATKLRVLPLFLGTGRHAREDLPKLLDVVRSAHPQVVVEVVPPAGEHPAVLDLLAKIAMA